MIIYRMTGKAEAFKNCGMLLIDPQANTSQAGILRQAKAASAAYDKAELKHTLIVKKLTIKSVDQETLLVLFGPLGYIENLIESEETIGAFASNDLPTVMPKVPSLPDETVSTLDDLPF